MTAAAPSAPALADGRLLLRPLRPEDLDAFYAAVDESRTEVGRWMAWCKPGYSIADAQEWLAISEQSWASETGDRPFSMFEAASGEFLGNMGLNHFNRVHHFANLGYWVRTSRTRTGVASAAVRMVARYGFESLGLARVEIVAQVSNVASRRVAEKAGGRLEGIARDRLAYGDRHFDAAMYSLLPGDI